MRFENSNLHQNGTNPSALEREPLFSNATIRFITLGSSAIKGVAGKVIEAVRFRNTNNDDV